MRAYRFPVAVAAVVATFALLVVGGLVHPTGSSLACPDWPLCNGQVFPAMRGGVLYEHGHRLVALAVVALTLALAGLVLGTGADRATRWLAIGAVLLVGLQAALGAITVLLRLPLVVSTAHLATSMAFFALLIALAHRLRPEGPPAAAAPRSLVGLAAVAVYVQIVLGALVRHTGSALACGTDVFLCDGTLLPAWGPAQIHMAHRLGGYLVAALVIGAAARTHALDRTGPPLRRGLAAVAPLLVLAQVALGLLTVATAVALPVVTLHLAVGTLLLADLVALHLLLGPGGATARPAGGPAARLVPAR